MTYVPVELHGQRVVGQAPWVSPGEAFSFITHDTLFAWSVIHPGSQSDVTTPPLTSAPASDAKHQASLAPGETTEALFVLGVGVEEFSAAHAGRALRELLERCAVMAQRSRGEKRIVRRNDQARARQRLYRNKSGRGFEFRMHVVTCEKIDAVKRVAGD